MQDNTFTHSGPKIAESTLAALEEQLGCTLPEDYRSFLLEYNGGDPEKSFFRQEGSPFPSSVDWLCTIDERLARSDSRSHYKTLAAAHAKYGNIVPKDMLIIGRSDQDDPLMLSIRGDRKRRVFVKRMDYIEPADFEELATRPEEHVYEVAESFEKFMDSLDCADDESDEVETDTDGENPATYGSPKELSDTSDQDLNRDAAALFRHMQKAGIESEQFMRWSFMFESDEIERLEDLGEFFDSRLREFFHVLLQESTEECHANGSVAQGLPLLRLEFVGVVDEPMLAGLHERLGALADKYDVRYLGCSNYSEFPFDLAMFDAVMGGDA